MKERLFIPITLLAVLTLFLIPGCKGKGKVTVEGEYEGWGGIVLEDGGAGEGEVNPPKGPAGLEVGVGKNKVVVSWKAVDGADGYMVHYDINTGIPYEGEDANEGISPIRVTGTSIDLTGLKPGKTYYFTITAFNSAGLSPYSSEVAAVMVPGSPGGITATGGITQIVLSWDGVHGAEGYRVYYDIDSGEPYNGADADQGTSPIEIKDNGITLTGLKEGTTYYIVVKAYNASGERGQKTEMVVATIPSQPVGITATSGGPGEVTLRWDMAEGVTSYKVYYDNDASGSPYEGKGAEQGPSPVFTNKNEMTLRGLISGYKYYFAVSAVNASGESSLSLEASVSFVPEGYRLVTGDVVGFGGEAVSSDRSLQTRGHIFAPSEAQGNKYRIRLE